MLANCEALLILGVLINPCDQLQLIDMHEPEACIIRTQDLETGKSQETIVDVPCTEINQEVWKKKNELEVKG